MSAGSARATALAFALLLCSAVADTPAAGAAGGSSASRRFLTEFLQEPPAAADAPQFDLSVASNLTGLVGQPVRLLCRVRALGNRTVSWVRHRDTHLLTVGRYTYTSDQRFEAQHSPHSEEWALRIRPAQRRDTGTYECQVSTTPPIGHRVFLSVVEPETEILGGPELHINLGSTINLTCLVRHAPEPPPSITWSHGEQVINFDSARGGISLVTEKGAASSSRLLVQRAGPRDSGLYTCAPSNAPPATVRVHILSGEHPAAMHGAAPAAGCGRLLRACLLLHALLVLLLRPPAARLPAAARAAGAAAAARPPPVPVPGPAPAWPQPLEYLVLYPT